jgi:polyhydroxybutyrate depolymerase
MRRAAFVMFVLAACDANPSPRARSSSTAAPSASSTVVVANAAPSPSASAPAAGADRERPYTVRVPKGYDASTPAPLVIALHGLGGWGAELSQGWGLPFLADTKKFLLVAPDGTYAGDQRFWNATDACCNFQGSDVDDVAYLASIIDGASAKYAVDPKRVYVIGFSNGAFMSHRAACDLAPRIAAIASVAGGVWKDASRCKPESHVSVLEVHGSADQIIHYDGGKSVHDGAHEYPAAKETVATWAAKNGCTGELAPSAQAMHLDFTHTGFETHVARYTGCPADGAVELWTMNGTSHFPKVQIPTWGEALWGFLSAHSKP